MNYLKAADTANAVSTYTLRLGGIFITIFALDGWQYGATILHKSIGTVIWDCMPCVITVAVTLAVICGGLATGIHEGGIAYMGEHIAFHLPFSFLSVFVSIGYISDSARYPILWWVLIGIISAWGVTLFLRGIFHIIPHISECKAILKEAGSSLRQIWLEHRKKRN